jgi:hypothetical protein
MPITFDCSCGKRLRVKDELAGRRVKCPACAGAVTVPAPPAEPAFEVVEDDEPAPTPAPKKAPAKKADTAGFNFSSSSTGAEKPRTKGRSKLDEDDDEEDERTRSKRRRRDDDEDDDEDERPRRKKSRRAAAESNLGKRIGYMVGGMVLVLIGIGLAAIGWFGEGRGATKMLIFGICLGIGGIGTGIKGLTGNVDDD